MTTATAPRRDWMKIAAERFEPHREQIEQVIAGLTWQRPVPAALPMMPGEAVKACIRQLAIPKVSGVAVDGALEWIEQDERVYPGLYGIEGNYSNGVAQLYVIDYGTEILPVCADFAASE